MQASLASLAAEPGHRLPKRFQNRITSAQTGTASQLLTPLVASDQKIKEVAAIDGSSWVSFQSRLGAVGGVLHGYLRPSMTLGRGAGDCDEGQRAKTGKIE